MLLPLKWVQLEMATQQANDDGKNSRQHLSMPAMDLSLEALGLKEC
jgi:hypothetical protein